MDYITAEWLLGHDSLFAVHLLHYLLPNAEHFRIQSYLAPLTGLAAVLTGPERSIT